MLARATAPRVGELALGCDGAARRACSSLPPGRVRAAACSAARSSSCAAATSHLLPRADGRRQRVDDIKEQTAAVLDRAAVIVGPHVDAVLEELVDEIDTTNIRS